MFDVKETFGRLNLYLDHLDMNLSEYLSQAITYDMDAYVSKKTGPSKKRYCNNFSLDEMVDWAEMEVEKPDGVETSTSNIEKGIDATDGVEARTSTTDKDEENSDKSVDYLSPGEEELIELRNRMKANREAKDKAKDNPIFEINKPNNENSMPTDNVRGETSEEHDIYMNELLKSLNTADKDEINKDSFISVEKHVERLVKSMSGEVRVVAKCGKRPPRLYDPEKGKQRQQTKYPSASSDDLPICPWRSILDFNPGSTVKLRVIVNPDGKTYFDRFYVCFAGLADGWKAWCRKIIALDGCILKSPNQGEILTAIERDGNNHIYLVVNVENKDNWA
ncbi:hypothetical protein Tco_0299709 [Tanacetum coccineum]